MSGALILVSASYTAGFASSIILRRSTASILVRINQGRELSEQVRFFNPRPSHYVELWKLHAALEPKSPLRVKWLAGYALGAVTYISAMAGMVLYYKSR